MGRSRQEAIRGDPEESHGSSGNNVDHRGETQVDWNPLPQILTTFRDNKLPERKTKELIKKLEEHKNISENLEDKRFRLVRKYALKWGVKEQGNSKDK